MVSNVVSPAYRALEVGLRRGVVVLLLGFVLGCTGDDSPVAPTRPSSPTSDVTLSSSLAHTAEDHLRVRGHLFDIQCVVNPSQCLLFLRQGVVLATESTVLLRSLPDGTQVTLTYEEFEDLLRLGLPIRVQGSGTNSEGQVIAEQIRLDWLMDIKGTINVASEGLTPGAAFKLTVVTVFGQDVILDFQVSGSGLDEMSSFPTGSRVNVLGVVPQAVTTPYIANEVMTDLTGPTSTTVAGILEEGVVGEVLLEGTIKQQVDDDEFIFRDRTGEIRLAFKTSTVPPVGQRIRVVGTVSSNEVDVSFWEGT